MFISVKQNLHFSTKKKNRQSNLIINKDLSGNFAIFNRYNGRITSSFNAKPMAAISETKQIYSIILKILEHKIILTFMSMCIATETRTGMI